MKRRLQTTDEVDSYQHQAKKPKTAAGEVSETRDIDKIWSARNIKTKYTMHKKIGKGGGGVVYSGESSHPSNTRLVVGVKGSPLFFEWETS